MWALWSPCKRTGNDVQTNVFKEAVWLIRRRFNTEYSSKYVLQVFLKDESGRFGYKFEPDDKISQNAYNRRYIGRDAGRNSTASNRKRIDKIQNDNSWRNTSKSSSKNETPTQILRRLTKELRKELYYTQFDISERFPEKPTETADISDEIKYSKELIEAVKQAVIENGTNKAKQALTRLEGLLSNDKIKEIQSVVEEERKAWI